MKRLLYILTISILIISCDGAQEVLKSSMNDVARVSNKAIDSVNSEFDKITFNGPFKDEETVAVTTQKKDSFQHTIWNDLLQKHVTDDGKVRYTDFQKDHITLQTYITSLQQNTPTENWTREAKLAYWINAYNALTVDLILKNYPLKSIKDIRKPWHQRLWQLGDKMYDLDEIEHFILRKMNEPRIHFAINCASFSCPPLLNVAFTETKLETQLTKVTKDFLANKTHNTITADAIEISRIFKWFASDFKENGSLIDFLNQYSDIKINATAKKSYKDYNWTLNE
ncbi:DUF547 domain-containing protein [Kordia jejudonensis]|uniref:DUF547 domain-containing protein n=1 Tax=Kordia jejudonensis TaxID=1348245 RepID=UPI00062954D5|nr:DUF547 domain-containing protein [Kordia jejudonensis]